MLVIGSIFFTVKRCVCLCNVCDRIASDEARQVPGKPRQLVSETERRRSR